MTEDCRQALLPCPFCGCKPLIDDQWSEGFEWPRVLCTFTGCTVSPSTSRYRSEESAIKAWNRRAAPELPPFEWSEEQVEAAVNEFRHAPDGAWDERDAVRRMLNAAIGRG